MLAEEDIGKMHSLCLTQMEREDMENKSAA